MSSSFKNLKKSVTFFFNSYWLVEYVMLLKYQQLSFRKSDKKPMLVSIVDNRRRCNGLTDRFKGIIRVYALAKAIDVPYRCIYNHPVFLTSFLVDRKSVVLGKGVSVRVDLGGRRLIKKKI